MTTHLSLIIHNKLHKISTEDVTPETTLNQFLRQKSLLTGTKAMCLEGGCGSCIVAISNQHPITKRKQTFSVNSCLVSIYSCHGCEIHTVEGIGNKLIGYHPIQKQLAKFNGTQCGFCSPGMVMSMYALSESSDDLTMADVENNFGGNICRCTGYRPILSAFKDMVSDADPAILGYVMPDIEDILVCPKRKNSICEFSLLEEFDPNKSVAFMHQNNEIWIKVYNVVNLVDIVKGFDGHSYMLIAGNTAKGVYKTEEKLDRYVDITNVLELISYNVTEKELQLGANLSLNETIKILQKVSKNTKSFSYTMQMAKHIGLIANPPVRNVGTLAGNLMLKHTHPDFPSDIFLLLATIGAKLIIINVKDNTEMNLSMENFLTQDMTMKIIKCITLPALDDEWVFHSYKIMKRAENTHAMVNAGFLIQLDSSKTVKSASIVFGNIASNFIHAASAENYLIGKPLYENESIQNVCQILNEILKPDLYLTEPSPEYRKQLAVALYYKFILHTAPDNLISSKNKSGKRMVTLDRPVSTGLQDYETEKSMYPLTEPVQKLEALAQTSGEAEYIFDRPPAPGQLYAAFVEAKAMPLSVIENIDPSEALKMEGVVAYVDKNDVPGKNTFIPNESTLKLNEEELFCSGKVLYFHQPIGIIVATSQELANKASELVKVTYKKTEDKPYFTNRQVLEAKDYDRIYNETVVPAKRTGDDVKLTVEGKYDIGGQYHFHMETQICSVEPVEDGYYMYVATQWMDLCHIAASKAINVPESRISIYVRRLGGAFGAKLSRSSMVSTACIVAVHKLKKPVSMWMTLEKNMNIMGKRNPVSADYNASINTKGEIQSLKNYSYSNYGYYYNEPTYMLLLDGFKSCYDNDTWYININHCITNNTPNTWTRGPGSVEGSSMIETIMEHLSIHSGIDPFDLRYNNLKKDSEMFKLMGEIKKSSNYTERQNNVKKFNDENRWIKKGLSIVPMRFQFGIFGYYNCMVSIINGDGSVCVSHGGIEMGQGINTIVAQTVAYLFNIPLDLIQIRASNNIISANGSPTGGSITTESICCAVIKACTELLDRLKPYKKKMKRFVWSDLIEAANVDGVDLTAHCLCYPPKEMKTYNIFGVAVTEVEVDILTGLFQILRMDILEDAGRNLNPNINVGQIEGAVVMGIGLWMFEDLTYDEQGQLLTNRTWTYTPPGAKDIPVDLRVKLLKKAPNPLGVLKTKAISEPPLLLAYSVPLAVRRVLASARNEAQASAEKWVPLNGVTSPEFIFLNALNTFEQYKL